MPSIDSLVEADEELVVLVDDHGRRTGTAAKRTVHHAATPLHLAFSCWVFDEAGRTLLTQRSFSKITWPGVWTNTFCGHPAPDESIEAAVHRRAVQELGAPIAGLQAMLPDFRYRAVMEDGTAENEICPTFRARLVDPVRPDPIEVADVRWITLAQLRASVANDPARYSPWMREQLALLG